VPINPAPVITMRIAKLNETFRSRFWVHFKVADSFYDPWTRNFERSHISNL